jgi:glycosyltransferase involved in cell wall biosynthesis
MRTPIVSVIIPFTYEGGLITECLDSVRRQSFPDIEIICVDNHADTDTRNRVVRAASADRRLIAVECKAQGSGPARNKGIETARGRYVAFVDADDFFYSPDSIKCLYEAAETTKADLARGNVYVFWPNTDSYSALETLGQRIWFYEEKLAIYENEPLLWLPVQHQAYLFNRDFLIRRRLTYPSLLRGQDQPFVLSVLLSDAKVIAIDRPTYVYRKGHRTHDLLAEPRNYLDRMTSIRKIKSALLKRGLEVQWHLVYARMASYMERATRGSSELRTTDVMGVIQDIVRGLDRFGSLDYCPYTLGSAGQSLLKHALRQGWI